MENIERFLNEEIKRIEEELRLFGRTTLVTFTSQDLVPLAMSIIRKNESKWSENLPKSIREGVEVIKDDFYITIIGEVNGKQFAISKKIEF